MRGNSVSVKGNVTRDAEVRRTQSGSNAVSWGIAWNQRRKRGEEWVDEPHYFDVSCWMTDRQLSSVQPQIVKGAGCAVVDGHLEFQQWEAQDGSKRSRVAVRVDDPIAGLLLTPPKQYQQQPMPQAQAVAGIYDEDIPF